MKIMILGNGTSRLNYSDFISEWGDEIWVCNLAYKENIKFNLVGSVHSWCVEDAIKYREQNKLNYEILYHSYMNKEIKNNIFKKYLGYCTGVELINEALLRDYNQIYLLGFDSLNNSNEDIYTKNLIIKNFKKQIDKIIEMYKLKKIKFKDNIWVLNR